MKQMSGESGLPVLLKSMEPFLHEGEFVFCSVPEISGLNLSEVIGLIREEEGTSVIVSRSFADGLGLDYSFVAAWITLKVYSSLEAVGLTAAFSTALAKEGISCNVVACFYHDHLFVKKSDSLKAIQVLKSLSE